MKKKEPFDLQRNTPRWFGCYDHPRGELFTVESNRHPAKMAVGLCERIFTYGRDHGYWKPGDVILDPMAGIGTTLIVGGVLGYRCIGIELESHFIKLCMENIAHAYGRFPPTGDAEVLQGDARELARILLGGRAGGEVHQSETGRAAFHPRPFFEAPSGGGINVKGYGPEGADKVGERTYSSNTVHGSVASPPYCGHVGHPDADEAAGKGLRVEVRQRCSYTATRTDGQQIGNLRDPKADIDNLLGGKPSPAGETYCAAMLRVYQGLYAVLRAGGVVALVTKNPVKKGAIRRLDLDTIRLMQAAGFTFMERHRAMLAQDLGEQGDMFGAAKTVRHERKSFFKRLFEKKYPHLRVDHEDVLWFRKANATADERR